MQKARKTFKEDEGKHLVLLANSKLLGILETQNCNNRSLL